MKKEKQGGKDKEASGLMGALGLVDQLAYVRKRKRAFGGQTVDMEAVRRRVDASRRRKRG